MQPSLGSRPPTPSSTPRYAYKTKSPSGHCGHDHNTTWSSDPANFTRAFRPRTITVLFVAIATAHALYQPTNTTASTPVLVSVARDVVGENVRAGSGAAEFEVCRLTSKLPSWQTPCAVWATGLHKLLQRDPRITEKRDPPPPPRADLLILRLCARLPRRKPRSPRRGVSAVRGRKTTRRQPGVPARSAPGAFRRERHSSGQGYGVGGDVGCARGGARERAAGYPPG